MAWTYDATKLDSDKLMQVRFAIGDTIEDDPLLQDEEINHEIAINTSTLSAAIECCEAIAAKFARKADYNTGPVSVKASQQSVRYTRLAASLRAKASMQSAPVYTNPDRAIFSIDMMNSSCDHHDIEE
jgi:hypothetical protein